MAFVPLPSDLFHGRIIWLWTGRVQRNVLRKLWNKYRSRHFIRDDAPNNPSEVSVSEVHPSETATAEKSTLQQLHDTMDLIAADTARAELWATALRAFAQPVPEYDRVLVPVEKWAQTQQL